MRKATFVLCALFLLAPLAFFGCGSGSDGAPGAQGPPGIQGDPGPAGGPAPAAASVQPESCAICHPGVGDAHQATYNQYTDASTLSASIVSVTSVDNGTAGFYDVTMVFDVTQNGQPYIDTGKSSNGNGFPTIDQKTFYAVKYDSATRKFPTSKSFDQKTITHLGNGRYSIVATGSNFAPENDNAAAYLYLAKGLIPGLGSHYTLYTDVINVGKGYGDVGTYQTAAKVAGCEKCHGAPYRKHGYRMAAVSGLTDFAACKTCHYDTRSGGHQAWQVLVDDPLRYAETVAVPAVPLTTEEKAYYAYTASVMNDVHMSHAMEFPYPQSMANCTTCHEGKLNMILTDANFKAQTCKSCHPVTGPAEGTEANRAPAMTTIWTKKNVLSFHNMGLDCTGCHFAGNAIGALTFSQIHTGYDKKIYTAAGQKYSAALTVTIDNDASFANNQLTFGFSATGSLGGFTTADIFPTVLVGLYGWDTKDFIVGPHESVRGADNVSRRFLEYTTRGGSSNSPNITVTSPAAGKWQATADLSTWAAMIADGTVKRVEIAVLPSIQNAAWGSSTLEKTVALNAPSRTFDLGTKAFVNFYDPIVKVAAGCNNCHEALGTTFHSGDRGGNIVVCRLCHITKSGGSHLEMQSRSIDSYVHAIHSFQAFDIGDIDFTDPVAAMRYDLHSEHVYPNFTIKNCESCHEKGKYNVPDQSKSLPGLLSGSDPSPKGWDRNIGTVPAYVTGPASRACGGCHRAEFIKEDKPGELAAFNQHTNAGGYLVENTDSTVLDTVIDCIMKYVGAEAPLAQP